MLNLLHSLSLESGSVVVAVASALFGIVSARLGPAILRWALALGAPLALSYALYWSPVWLGDDPLEYRTWAPLFVGAWYLAGAIASSLVV